MSSDKEMWSDSFDFLTMRELVRTNYDLPIEEPYSDDQLLRRIISELDSKTALRMLNNVLQRIMSYSETTVDWPIYHQAMLLRSKVYMNMKKLPLARKDVESAILAKPTYILAYEILSEIEAQDGQLGRAEVILRLGLLLDPKNGSMTEKLDRIRRENKVHPNVSINSGSAFALEEKAKKANVDLDQNLPNLVRDAMCGNVSDLHRAWRPEFRHYTWGDVDTPLIHFPVLGMQRPGDLSGQELDELVEECKATIDFLYERGVRLDAQDYSGATAVMLAAGHPAQPELLEHLLKRGADPNVRSCYGTVALMNATMKRNVREIDLLLQYDADPFIVDNDGVTPHRLCQHFDEVRAVYQRHLHSEITTEKICMRCCGEGSKRCTKCRMVWYCSRSCQESDWDYHKRRCKELRKSHKRVTIDLEGEHPEYDVLPRSTIDNLRAVKFARLYTAYNEEWQRNGNMMIKVEASRPITPDPDTFNLKYRLSPNPDRSMLAYNENGDFGCMLDNHKLDGPELLSIVQDKGVGNVKAFFWAYMESGKDEITIITDPVFPLQSW